MNYEILSKLAMEETDKLKSEKSILAKRNDILHMEIENLKKMIRELQADKEELTKIWLILNKTKQIIYDRVDKLIEAEKNK